MTNSDYWWEPPRAGSEAEHLAGMLDRLRPTFRFKADELDAAGLNTKIAASTLTIGGLLKHLALYEDYHFGVVISGEKMGPEWADWDEDDDNWEFKSAAEQSPEELYALWDGAVARSRARLTAALAADGGLDRLVHPWGPKNPQISVRRLLCDKIEEYGRHTGHADLIREAVDGRVGEDPTKGWQPVSGRGQRSA